MQSSVYYRAAELLLAVLGLAFGLSTSCQGCMVLVIGYAGAIIYLLMILIQELTKKHAISDSVQLVAELVLALVILGLSVYVITIGNKDTWIILAIIVGFLLPALFLLTAFEKM